MIQSEEGKAVPTGTSYEYIYYLEDHLGNTRVTLGTKTGRAYKYQTDNYYPFGLEIPDTISSPKNEYLYNKKELQEELGQYDYGARFYDPVIGRWTTIDPLTEKSKRLSPCVYGLNNPIRFVDPDGMEVITNDDQSRKNITHSLTKEEAKYIKFDKAGKLDTKKLNKFKGFSDNFNALKTLANSKIGYHFAVTSEYTSGNGKTNVMVGDDGNGTRGVTLLPGATNDPSPDNDVYIYTSDKLSEERQVRNTAHEGYAHAYLYELKQQGQDVDPNHQYEGVITYPIDPDTKQPILTITKTETNIPLKTQLKKVEKQAVENYRTWKEGNN